MNSVKDEAAVLQYCISHNTSFSQMSAVIYLKLLIKHCAFFLILATVLEMSFLCVGGDNNKRKL